MDIPVSPSSHAGIVLSVVVPAYNEAAGIAEFHRRLGAVLDAIADNADIIYVNDGSRDSTLSMLHRLAAQDDRMSILELSRNFGKEAAMTAGIDYSRGAAVVVIDADLQDPPELIAEMLREWQRGFEVVLMRRRAREGESWLKTITAAAFYRFVRHIGEIEIPAGVGDFRLLSRRAVDALGKCRERARFMKGLFAWIGFSAAVIDYDRHSRFAGNSKWSYWRLWNFALDGITSFGTAPLKLASYAGGVTALMAFGYAAFTFGKALIFGDAVRGFPTLLIVILFLGGLQLLALGIIGEYLARMFVEVKQRPLYLVERVSCGHAQPESGFRPVSLRGNGAEVAGNST